MGFRRRADRRRRRELAIEPLTLEALKVVHFHRKPLPTHYSVEGYFARLREAMRSSIDVEKYTVPFHSRGLFRRLWNSVCSALHQRDINHITGDIHYISLFLRREKTLLTVLDCQILERLTGVKRAALKLFWFTLPARRVSMITVISAETKRELLTHVRFPESQIHVVPVCVSPIFQPNRKEFNTDCPHILQVGTKPNKNIPRLVQALEGMRCRLTIVGPLSDALLMMLKECAIDYDNIVGPTDQQVVELYGECDIVSFVSTYEGFGMPIVEAQWVERPVVTSNCSSMPEVAGDGACFVDPFDVPSIRQGFRRVIADDVFRERILQGGRDNRTRFDEQTVADRYNQLYRRMSGGSPHIAR